MARRKYTPEQIIGKLREVEVALAQGSTVALAVRSIEVTEQTYYRWRREYGGLNVEQARRLKELEKENLRLRRAVSESHPGRDDPRRGCGGRLLSPSRRRMCVERVQRVHPGVSERRACRALSQARSTQRHHPRIRDDEEALRADIVALATRFGRYGYRRITALLKELGWQVNHKRVERIWRREGLKVPMKQPKRGRLWLGDGSLIRLRPDHVNHVWAYDFVPDASGQAHPSAHRDR